MLCAQVLDRAPGLVCVQVKHAAQLLAELVRKVRERREPRDIVDERLDVLSVVGWCFSEPAGSRQVSLRGTDDG